jgi:flagellar hook-length control protein FliK
VTPPRPDKDKLSAVKLPEHGPAKHRDTKKSDSKEPKTDVIEASLATLLPVQIKPEQPANPQKTSESEAFKASADKGKILKTESRNAAEIGQAAAWNPSSPENARHRGQMQGNEVRKERSEEKPKVFVVDRRTEAKEKDKLKLPGAEGAAQQSVSSPTDIPAQNKNADSKTDQVQVSFQAAAQKGQGQGSFDIQAQNTPVSPRDAASFQQYLVERGYGQMVDQARIVLKDQNAGEIRMTLYPESLGKVKVSLNLSDSSLAGQIFVENQTVKDVFQANMDNLLQAFRDGGWNDLSLQVSVGGERGPGNGGQSPQHSPQAQDYGRQVAQTVSDGQTNRIGSWNDRQINLTA